MAKRNQVVEDAEEQIVEDVEDQFNHEEDMKVIEDIEERFENQVNKSNQEIKSMKTSENRFGDYSDLPEIEDKKLLQFVAEHHHEVIGLGECKKRLVEKVVAGGNKELVEEIYVAETPDDNSVVYRVGWLFRLQCVKCGDPRCSRIVYKLDEDKKILYRSCKQLKMEFGNIDHAKVRLEVE